MQTNQQEPNQEGILVIGCGHGQACGHDHSADNAWTIDNSPATVPDSVHDVRLGIPAELTDKNFHTIILEHLPEFLHAGTIEKFKPLLKNPGIIIIEGMSSPDIAFLKDYNPLYYDYEGMNSRLGSLLILCSPEVSEESVREMLRSNEATQRYLVSCGLERGREPRCIPEEIMDGIFRSETDLQIPEAFEKKPIPFSLLGGYEIKATFNTVLSSFMKPSVGDKIDVVVKFHQSANLMTPAKPFTYQELVDLVAIFDEEDIASCFSGESRKCKAEKMSYLAQLKSEVDVFFMENEPNEPLSEEHRAVLYLTIILSSPETLIYNDAAQSLDYMARRLLETEPAVRDIFRSARALDVKPSEDIAPDSTDDAFGMR